MAARPITAALLLALTGAAAGALSPPAPTPAQAPAAPAPAAQPTQSPRSVDLAICLDTSNSMDNLIDAARQKIWEVVNDLATAEPRPRLRVALLQYGNDSLESETGWVKLETGFTDDLDLVSQRLFALKTNGGTELVGRVVDRATQQLEWSADPAALRIMVVAGNESADQDAQVAFRTACSNAIAKGVMINSIYCGDAADQLAPAWREVASLTDGQFAAIDAEGAVAINTPFDEELVRLSSAINETYIPYGAAGEAGVANQVMQDANASTLNVAAAAARCQTKGGGLYWNGAWDLVDACNATEKPVKLEDIKEADLPEAMRKMTLEERKAHIKQMAERRAEIQKTIEETGQKREQFIAQERAKQAEASDTSFETAVRKAVREQAESKGFRFKRSG